ncbi:MAG: rRNA maturation RNase YbeY [Candidatus Omnitrophica bacterium]|jgi:rRNA maturation RNase YbeY|nr:rRNA maturation RNase YbeY [Candidatus Omnitrophota bacterium]
MKVILHNGQSLCPVPLKASRRLALNTLKRLGVDKNGFISVSFVDTAVIKKLNRNFFKKDRLTDVIALAYKRQRSGSCRPLYDGYLGDIFICPVRVRENAARYKQPYPCELSLCIVHGILHLLGYDDTKPGPKKKMWQKQNWLIKK